MLVKLVDKGAQMVYEKGIIAKANSRNALCLSNIFSKHNTAGKLQLLLDLPTFKKQVGFIHFKMGNVQQAVNFKVPSGYLASIDWKDVCYCIPVARRFRKYLALFGFISTCAYLMDWHVMNMGKTQSISTNDPFSPMSPALRS